MLLFSSCNTTNYSENFRNSKTVSYNLIKLCVDKAMETEPQFNTKNYVLDLSNISTLNSNGVDSFLKVKNSIMPTTHEDSVMTFENKEWTKFHMNRSMVIRIKSIDSINEKNIKVSLTKYKSTDETINAEIEFERHNNTYKIVGCKLTK
jgi:hypothetical protein